MKVLFITNLFPPHYLGGYEVACKDIVEEFKKNGHSVTVLTSSYGIGFPSKKNGIYRVLKVKTNFNGYKSLSEKIFSLFFNPFNYKKTLDIINEIKPDVVSIWNLNGISVSPLFALQKMHIPYVVHLFDRSLSFLRKKGWKGVLNLFLFNKLKLDHIISCSESLKSNYVRRGFEGSSITVIHHGIIPEKVLPNGKTVDKNNLKLLFVGQLWEAKGADLAIRSLSRLEEHGIFAILTIVGDGKKSYKRDLRKIAKENDIIDRVDFIGKVTREELKNFYRDNDILLFPTYSWYKEPFGIVILEAMNQGISVIASNSGGPKEIIIDGENGLLFEPGKVESLTKKIINLVKAPQLYKGIRKKAFDSINDIFNIAFVGKRIIMFYNNIL